MHRGREANHCQFLGLYELGKAVHRQIEHRLPQKKRELRKRRCPTRRATSPADAQQALNGRDEEAMGAVERGDFNNNASCGLKGQPDW